MPNYPGMCWFEVIIRSRETEIQVLARPHFPERVREADHRVNYMFSRQATQ